MESAVIENLLDRYFEAKTTVEEENKLRNYFSSDVVAPHLQGYAPLFGYFEEERQEKFPGAINYTASKKKVYSWVAVAASIMIIFGATLQEDQSRAEFGTYEDPEVALQKTREALQMVSHLMNDGTEELSYLQEFNYTTNKITKTQ